MNFPVLMQGKRMEGQGSRRGGGLDLVDRVRLRLGSSVRDRGREGAMLVAEGEEKEKSDQRAKAQQGRQWRRGRRGEDVKGPQLPLPIERRWGRGGIVDVNIPSTAAA